MRDGMPGLLVLLATLLAAAPAPAQEDDMAQLREALRRTTAALRETQEALARLRAQAAPAGDRLQSCREKNGRLISLGEEILHLYETQDFRSLLVASYEPLLGLKRVELENLVQDYDDRLRDQDVAIMPGASKP